MQLSFEDRIITINKDDAILFTHLTECFLLNDDACPDPIVIPFAWPNVGTTGTLSDLLTLPKCDSSTCSLLVNVLTYLHPVDITVITHLLSYIAINRATKYILRLSIDKLHLMYITDLYLKYREDKYTLSISEQVVRDIYIHLHKRGRGHPLDTVWCSTPVDKFDHEVFFRFDLIDKLLKRWAHNKINYCEHLINYKFNLKTKKSKITLSIGSYNKEVLKVDGKYDLHDHIVDYIKMQTDL